MGTVDFTASPNNGVGDRTGTLTIGGQPVSITQSACAYVFSPPFQTLDSTGGTGQVTVATGAGCGWTIANTNSWITLLSGISGSGNGTLLYNVDPNPDSRDRTGVILIAGQPYGITQWGLPCSFGLDPEEWSHESGLDFGEINVTNASGSAACYWTVQNTADWISILSGQDGFGDGSVVYMVNANLGAPRSANLTVAGQEITVAQLRAHHPGRAGDGEFSSFQPLL